MNHYEPKSFIIPHLQGISSKNIEEHLRLYEGYVKHTNLIADKIAEYSHDIDRYRYEIGELRRRFSFEYNGMKNHEYYFEQLTGAPTAPTETSRFFQTITASFGSWDAFITALTTLALTRGVGWAIIYLDQTTNTLIPAWIDEQHLGQLNSVSFIFGIDMWEHAYVSDYYPSGKAAYIKDYLANVNWNVVEKRIQ